MKKARSVLFLCLFAILCVAPAIAAGDPVKIAVTEGNGETVIKYTFGAYTTEPVEIAGSEYLTFDFGRENLTFEKGFPALPQVCRSVIVPNDASVKVEVTDSSYHVIGDIAVAPSKGIIKRCEGDPANIPYTFDSFYKTDAWYPGNLVTHREPYIMRDVRGTTVVVNPFQYNPAQKTLRVYDSMTVKVIARTGNQGATQPENELPNGYSKPCRAFQAVQKTHFINYLQKRYPPMNETGELLIITHDAFNANVQPLAAWKNGTGTTTTVVDVSTIGNNATSIKNYIQQYYDSHNLSFVLLVGDGPQVVSTMVYGDASDPAYSLLAGSDHYPDIFVGRFSASTAAQVDTQVERTIEYEQMSHTEPWFWKGTGIASSQGAGQGHYGESDDVHMGYIRDDLLLFGYTHVDEFYDPYASASDVRTAVNDGRGVINYCGHGSTTSWGTTGFDSNDVNALVNDNMLPFITSVACLNGNFYSGTCFAESWLRATHNGEPTGAIGMYASTISQSWAPPMEAQDEFVDRYCDFTYHTYGGLCFAGSCLMMDKYGSSGQSEFDYWTVFGDPSLSVRGGGGGAASIDLKVNDQDDFLLVPAGTPIKVSLNVTAGYLAGTQHDWWIWVERNLTKNYWFTVPGVWKQSASPLRGFNGPLVDLNDFVIANTKLPPGWWYFAFAVDELNNTYEGTMFDYVQVQIQ